VLENGFVGYFYPYCYYYSYASFYYYSFLAEKSFTAYIALSFSFYSISSIFTCWAQSGSFYNTFFALFNTPKTLVNVLLSAVICSGSPKALINSSFRLIS